MPSTHLRSNSQANGQRSAKPRTKPPHEYRSAHYDPLPKKRGAIRLLKLFSSSSNNPYVECELITPKEDSGELEDGNTHIQYEALSWCWGTEGKTSYISIRKGQRTYAKYVSPGLFAALRALRHHQKIRYLWVDAICIDQENLNEKNHQVEMMAEIYGNAVRVCIWLGDATNTSQVALRFIKKEVLQLQNFDDLCESPEASSKWRALLQLMQRPWFSRRWVVQEIALARKAVIYCGTDKISWNKFAIAVELFVEVETATHRLSEVMKKDPKYYHVPGWFEYVSALGASLLVDATGRLFRDNKEERHLGESAPEVESERDSDFDIVSESDTVSEVSSDPEATFDNDAKSANNSENVSDTKNGKRHPLLGLEYLVSSLSIFDTTVPHDTIYALLAIAKDTTPIAASSVVQQPQDHAQNVLEIFTQSKRYNVDYRLPYVDVCTEFIQFCIERSLQIDRSRALDVICRPWATEEKVLAAGRRAAQQEKRKQEKAKKERESRKLWLESKRAMKPGMHGLLNGMPRNTKVTNEEPQSRVTVEGTAQMEKDRGKMHQKDDVEKCKDLPLPSWIPQLSGAPYAMYPQAGIAGIKMSRKNADSLVGLPSLTQRNYAAAETKNVDMKTLKFRKRLEFDHFSMYVKGFVLDTIADVQPLARNGQIPQEWAELAGWPGAQGNPPDEFWRTLVANRGKDGKNPPVYYSRACRESFTKGGYIGGAVNTTDLINYERNSVVAQFCRRVQAVTWNRALVKTNKGRLGLVGKNVQSGDLVCILYGCSVPVVLRKSDRKSDTVFKQEMEWELKFLTQTLVNDYRLYRERMKMLKQRIEDAKDRFFRWELQKQRQWLKDQEWRRRWQDKLAAERAAEAKNDLSIKRQYDLEDVSKLEETVSAYRSHLRRLISNMDLRLGREFNAWKREKEDIAKKEPHMDWKPPVVKWSEFELRLKYGRYWRRRVKRRKEQLRKEFEAEWNKEQESRSRTHSRSTSTANAVPHTDTMSSEKLEKMTVEHRKSEHSKDGELADEAARGDMSNKGQEIHFVNGIISEKQLEKAIPRELSREKAIEYDRQIRENFKQRSGDDGYYHYMLFGECYIHGMMDGEAMAYQNENGISTTVFELR